jgi:transcriptional regulator of arginine metabolism
MSVTDSKSRLEALRALLLQSTMSTQDELREQLEQKDFSVTQSTISRDLRKLSAIKGIDQQGRTVYRLQGNEESPVMHGGGAVAAMVKSIEANAWMIVVHTSPGSASLVARLLDKTRPAGILGTIAGDDTIFVAPGNRKSIATTVSAIKEILRF